MANFSHRHAETLPPEPFVPFQVAFIYLAPADRRPPRHSCDRKRRLAMYSQGGFSFVPSTFRSDRVIKRKTSFLYYWRPKLPDWTTHGLGNRGDERDD
jgi:hypothetical protein